VQNKAQTIKYQKVANEQSSKDDIKDINVEAARICRRGTRWQNIDNDRIIAPRHFV
jgi:hypothetical protein